MIQHEESDDDDDFEGYFLQPVNGYNIHDKIKLANQELFLTPYPPTPVHEEFQRHVKFRDILEEYASEDSLANEKNNEDDDNNSILEELTIPIISEDNSRDIKTTMTSDEYNEEMYLDNISCDSTLEICEEIEGLTIKDSKDESLKSTTTNNNKLVKQETTIETSDFEDEQISVLENNKNIVNINLFQVDVPTEENILDDINELNIDLNFQNDTENTEEINKESLSNKPTKKLRLCCNYKLKNNTKLPCYNGYKSQYGLSKEQLHKRNIIFNHVYNKNINSFIKKQENYINKLIENENEFNKWLNKKINNPTNKTKNMYDYNKKNNKKLR